MSEERMRFGHSTRINFELPDLELDEDERDIMLLDKDLILKHELTSTKKENLRLRVAPNVTITIIEEFAGESEYADFFTEITLCENSKVNYLIKQELSKNSTLFQTCIFDLKKNSRLELLNVVCGCKQLKHKTIVHLAGEGAECQNNCVYFASGEQKFIIETSNIHHKRNTTSNMLTKGILDDKAKVVNTGVIKIRPDAWQSNGYQKGDYLLLSKTAEVNPIPELQIQNHDVKCSHGVSVSKIDEEKLFYFTSRGIPTEMAKTMFVQGFIFPALKFLSEKSKEEIIENLSKVQQSSENFHNRSEAEVIESL